jgi:hypothetical protein
MPANERVSKRQLCFVTNPYMSKSPIPHNLKRAAEEKSLTERTFTSPDRKVAVMLPMAQALTCLDLPSQTRLPRSLSHPLPLHSHPFFPRTFSLQYKEITKRHTPSDTARSIDQHTYSNTIHAQSWRPGLSRNA